MAVLILGILLLVVLTFVLLVGAARRRDTGEAIGELSRETRRRDRRVTAGALAAEAPPTGREVERAASAARTGKELVRAGTAPAPPAPFIPPDPEAVGVTRRAFFNRSIILMFGLGLGTFGAGVLAFLWPTLRGGFGSKIRVGTISDVLADIAANDGFLYVPEGRAWITAYPTGAVPKAEKAGVYDEAILVGLRAGVVALYQKCPHLGCRVPECKTSQWFECPCHGSQYNQVGEKKGGPAPRGMDHFGMEVTGGALIVNTGQIFPGPPIGTNTTGQEAEGPHCVTGGGGH
jgi:cytochrome b6-f complex iron-sulfur subunit